MRSDLWRRLVVWEVRHALRGATFWVMAVLAIGLPGLMAWSARGPETGSTAGVVAQVVTLSVLVSLWIVFAVRRQLAADVSDDWLLVLTYRECLASRFLAGLVLGLVLWAFSAGGPALLLAVDGSLAPDWFAYQPLVALALVQPLAVAAVVVGAADFLLATTPLVVFVVAALGLLWNLLPFAGFAVGLGVLTAGEEPGPGLFWILLAAATCLALLLFGWRRAEDFWAYLKVAWQDRQEASLGTVRLTVQGATAGATSERRYDLAGRRLRLRERGVSPLLAHDLARYPALARPRLTREVTATYTVLAIVAGALLLGSYAFFCTTSFWLYVSYFGRWILTALVVLRALTSGAQIVVQEKEQGTLAGLLLSPLGGRRLLARKLGVVLRQALPGLLLLTVLLVARQPYDLVGTVAALWMAVLCAAAGGVMASALARSRLLATLVGAVWAAGLWVTLTAVPEAARVLAQPSALHPASRAEHALSVLGLGLVGVVVTLLAGWLCHRSLARQAAA